MRVGYQPPGTQAGKSVRGRGPLPRFSPARRPVVSRGVGRHVGTFRGVGVGLSAAGGFLWGFGRAAHCLRSGSPVVGSCCRGRRFFRWVACSGRAGAGGRFYWLGPRPVIVCAHMAWGGRNNRWVGGVRPGGGGLALVSPGRWRVRALFHRACPRTGRAPALPPLRRELRPPPAPRPVGGWRPPSCGRGRCGWIGLLWRGSGVPTQLGVPWPGHDGFRGRLLRRLAAAGGFLQPVWRTMRGSGFWLLGGRVPVSVRSLSGMIPVCLRCADFGCLRSMEASSAALIGCHNCLSMCLL